MLYSSCTPPVQCRVRNRLAGWKVHCKLSCLFLLLNLSDIWLTLLWTQPPRPPSSHPSPAGSCQPKTPPLIPFSLTLLNGAGAGTEGQAQSPCTGEIIIIYARNSNRPRPQEQNYQFHSQQHLPDIMSKFISFPKAGWHPARTPPLCTMMLVQGRGAAWGAGSLKRPRSTLADLVGGLAHRSY